MGMFKMAVDVGVRVALQKAASADMRAPEYMDAYLRSADLHGDYFNPSYGAHARTGEGWVPVRHRTMGLPGNLDALGPQAQDPLELPRMSSKRQIHATREIPGYSTRPLPSLEEASNPLRRMEQLREMQGAEYDMDKGFGRGFMEDFKLRQRQADVSAKHTARREQAAQEERATKQREELKGKLRAAAGRRVRGKR